MTVIRTACLACAILLTATAAIATSSRVEALGKTGDYLEDDSNAWRWWGSLALYPDRVIVEPGQYHGRHVDDAVTDQGGALYVGLGAEARYGVLAVAVRDGIQEVERPGESFEAAYALRLGRVVPGIYFRGTSHQRFSREFPSYRNHNLWLHDLGIGLRVDLGQDHAWELAAFRRETQFIYGELWPTYQVEDIDWGTWGLRSRARLAVDDRLDLIPLVDYLSIDAGALDNLQHAPVHRTGEVWRVGLGGNLRPRSGQLVVFAAEYGREIVRAEPAGPGFAVVPADLDHWNATVRLGFETEVLPWLVVRGAATYQRQRTTVDVEAGELNIQQGAPTQAFLGVSLAFDALTIDAAYGHTTPLEPGQFQTDLYPDQSSDYLTGTLRYAW